MSRTTRYANTAWYMILNGEGRCRSWGRDVKELEVLEHQGASEALVLTFIDGKTSTVSLGLKDRYFILTNEFYKRNMSMHEWIETIENTYG